MPSLREDRRGPLTGLCDEVINDAGFPYRAHICEVKIDAEDCTVEIVNHVAVDGVGLATNPMIIHGKMRMARRRAAPAVNQFYLNNLI